MFEALCDPGVFELHPYLNDGERGLGGGAADSAPGGRGPGPECGSKALRSADDGYSNGTAPRHRRRAAKFGVSCCIMMSFFVIFETESAVIAPFGGKHTIASPLSLGKLPDPQNGHARNIKITFQFN
jgi:hypothetical protein